MPDEKEPMATVGVQLTKLMRQWLDGKVEESGGSLSQVIRSVLRKAMEDEGRNDS